ncbi:MAG: septation protein SepH [Marmoricola sp.]
MQDLTAVGLSQDGRRLLLISSAGEEFAVPVDTRLRAALRGDNARLGQLEMKMESALRPRDIQARIRAGESPEDVATAAGTTVEAIMGFAGPVLAERQHVAQTALKASVRRRSGESSSAGRTLGEAAELFFGDHTLHDEDVEWDAWRHPDGRWALVATYAVAGRARTAEFTHDLPGRYVVAENDEARILTGELSEPASHEPAGGRTTQAKRLSSVPSQDELPLGDDAIELVRDREPAADEPTDAAADLPLDPALDPAVGPVMDPAADTADVDWIATDPITEGQRDAGPGVQRVDEPPAEIDDAGPGADLADEPTAEVAPKKKSRSSVPSWDEIMFGGKIE